MADSRLRHSVIVCTRDRPGDLVMMLQSVQLQSLPPVEIVVVDCGTSLVSDARFARLWREEMFPKSTRVYLHTPAGLPMQRNHGANVATGDILHFLDDDVVLSASYLEEMDQAFVCNQDCLGGMGTVRPLRRYSAAEAAFAKVFLLQRNYASGRFTTSGMPTHAYGSDRFMRVEVLGGCCMAYRRSVLERYRFDESMESYAYMEDCDLSYRVSREGPLFYNPAAVLEHRQSPAARERLVDVRAMHLANYAYLFFKSFYPSRKALIIPFFWSTFGLFLEALGSLDIDHVRGYLRGLSFCIHHRGGRPFRSSGDGVRGMNAGVTCAEHPHE